MLPRFNIFVEWLCRWYLSRVSVSQRFLSKSRELRESGTVFYVVRDRSYLETLAANYLFRTHDVPLVPFAGNLRLWRFGPLARLLGMARDGLLRVLRLAPGRTKYRERLQRVVRRQENGLIFLKRGKTVLWEFFEGNDPFSILLEEARYTSRPLYLLPQFMILDMTPTPTKPHVGTRLFGSADEPSVLRKMWQVLKASRSSKLECGDPVCVQEFLQANPGLSEGDLVRKLKLALLEEFEAERKVFAGPRLRSRLDLKSELLRAPQLYDFMLAQAEREGTTKEEILKRADKIIEKMASDPVLAYALALKHVLFWGLDKTYESVQIDYEGLERVKAALKRGPVILLPNHSSHVDYLLISCLFNQEHLQLPQIAAGDNLTFWPMGHIFRKSSAFFIRRSFRGDRLYTQVFDTYLTYLLSEGFAIEFFIEGTRSRAGKLRQPQFGMLSRMVASYFEGHAPGLTFIPVGMDYERIFEENTYRREQQGAAKKKESATSLLSLPRALNEPRGHMYLRFGQEIDMEDFCRESGLNVSAANGRREVTRNLGVEILHRIQDARTVTATALLTAGILTEAHATLGHSEAVRRALFFREVLASRAINMGVGVSPADSDAQVGEAIAAAAGRLITAEVLSLQAQDGEDVYSVVPEQYLILDYYRNSLVNPLVDLSLVAHLMHGREGQHVAADDLRRDFDFLMNVLQKEVVTRFTDLDQAVQKLLEMGVVRGSTEALEVADETALLLLSGLTRAILDGYLCVASAFSTLAGEPIDKVALLELLELEQQKLHEAGRISRDDLLTVSLRDQAFDMMVDTAMLDRREQRGDDDGRKSVEYAVKNADAVDEVFARLGAILQRSPLRAPEISEQKTEAEPARVRLQG
ncbi:MAG: 1-acyl-sn-glycerol-3-phosphate acyltransferase [Chrysiogenetes bacterium]|nr:1-acyl-sn-glycerol-3-phosphate acyltransferase [Chrysiogenetes bacterium]